MNIFGGFGIGIIIILGLILSGIRILAEYERGVVFRLGRVTAEPKGPGLIWLIPMIDRMVRISTRIVTMDVPPQDVITRDNVSVKVNAVLYFRVMNPKDAVLQVENFMYATSQLSQTTLRSVLGEMELDDLLSEREKINHKLQTIIDQSTDPWGVKVTSVEVKHIDLPVDMQRAMARQAEAERERRAKVIAAEGEFQASEKLAQASHVLSESPSALQLRFLQTLVEVASENNTTTIFPIPIDLFKPFIQAAEKYNSTD
jgi:regulator of protease activity HflC (stomatin/prohibitin superfamily)